MIFDSRILYIWILFAVLVLLMFLLGVGFIVFGIKSIRDKESITILGFRVLPNYIRHKYRRFSGTPAMVYGFMIVCFGAIILSIPLQFISPNFQYLGSVGGVGFLAILTLFAIYGVVVRVWNLLKKIFRW